MRRGVQCSGFSGRTRLNFPPPEASVDQTAPSTLHPSSVVAGNSRELSSGEFSLSCLSPRRAAVEFWHNREVFVHFLSSAGPLVLLLIESITASPRWLFPPGSNRSNLVSKECRTATVNTVCVSRCSVSVFVSLSLLIWDGPHAVDVQSFWSRGL